MNLNAPAIRQLIDLAEANQDVFIENGKKFWGMPELGYREVKTSKYATACPSLASGRIWIQDGLARRSRSWANWTHCTFRRILRR